MDYKIFESRVLELVYKTDNQLTPQLAAYKIGCTVEQARTLLEAMSANEVLSMDVDEKGLILFDIPGRPAASGEPLSWAQGSGNTLAPISSQQPALAYQPQSQPLPAQYGQQSYPYQQSMSVPVMQPHVMYAPNGANLHQHVQVNVSTPIVIGAHKSVTLAVLLAFLFGPLGMLYSTVGGGLIMMLLSFLVIPLTLGAGIVLLIPTYMIWAGLAASSSNSRLRGLANR